MATLDAGEKSTALVDVTFPAATAMWVTNATRKWAPTENIDQFEENKLARTHRLPRGRGVKLVGLLHMRHIQGHTDQWHPHAIIDGTSGRDQGTRRI